MSDAAFCLGILWSVSFIVILSGALRWVERDQVSGLRLGAKIVLLTTAISVIVANMSALLLIPFILMYAIVVWQFASQHGGNDA
jgi:hypothetical protein